MNFVVLDELGYLPFAQSRGQLLFHLVSRLYKQSSVSGTINLTSGKLKCLPCHLDRYPQRLVLPARNPGEC